MVNKDPAHRILLDTHIALWMLLDDPRLPESIKDKLGNTDYCWFFHQVSLWEIQIKYNLKKILLPKPPEKLFKNVFIESGMIYRIIEDSAIIMVGKLPNHHRDPFDRLLIAHALVNNWQIATIDQKFDLYPVRLL